MRRHQLLFFFFFFYKTLVFSQFNLSGIVIDEKNEPLPFVNILINDSQKNGVSTDIDGKFTIQSKEPIKKLTLSFIGYEKLIYEVVEEDFGKKLKLQMTSKSFELVEAVVIAGENPAHRIIRRAVKNRNKNNPEKMQSFSCKTYNKVVIE